MHELNAGSVRANNVLFHYLTMGEGPMLLCLHGFPDHACSFHRQLRDFSALGYRVVAPLSYYRCAFGSATQINAHAALQRRIGTEPILVPCLYLHGEQDGCISHSVARNMAELFPGGFERHVMPGLGHFLHLEAPDKLNAVIAGYLKAAVKQE